MSRGTTHGSMGADRGADRIVRSWLHEDRHEDATRVLDAALNEVDTTPQRRSGGTAWRLLSMNNNIVRIGLAVAAVVVIAIIAINLLPGSPAPGGDPSVSPSVEPTASPVSSSSPASPPPLSQSFTSTLHGYSVSYPEGWTVTAATETWTASTIPLSFPDPQVDWMNDPILPTDLFLAIASQPIGDSTPDDWVAAQVASEEGCGTATEPITVDGASGLGCEGHAVVTTAGRGYWIQLYTGSEAPEGDYTALFEEILGTVQLLPEDAVD